jgi:hypothetical protein
MFPFLDAETMLLTADGGMWRGVATAWLFAAIGLACVCLA